MRISCIQMDMLPGMVEHNFARAEALIRQATDRDRCDVAVLPETWSTGFHPRDMVEEADRDGERTRAAFSALARELHINIVCGSVATSRDGDVYNTAYVFDREGRVVASYDKTHLFSYGGEDRHVTPGSSLCTFTLEGRKCALIICYDIRFPELARACALQGAEVLFAVAQWPRERMEHLEILSRARAIENEMFVVLCNSVGTVKHITCGGGSAVIDPWGQHLARAGDGEEIITAEIDFSQVGAIRSTIDVFRDRRPRLYRT